MFLIFCCLHGQYHFTSHLSGSCLQNDIIAYESYGETGVYEKGNTIGSLDGGFSFYDEVNSELIVCYGETWRGVTDQIWKFSHEIKQWKFVKGRSEGGETLFNETNIFSEEIQISVKKDVSGWKSLSEKEDISTKFFWGKKWGKYSHKRIVEIQC